MKKLIVAFFALIVIGFGAITYYIFKSMTIDSLVYGNPDYGFTINFPVGVTMINNRDDIASSGYIPVCDPETSIVCLVFPDTTYPNSNFSQAGVSVNVLPTLTNETVCNTPDTNRNASDRQTVIINGLTFTRFSMGDAAAGHQSGGFNYRTFHDNQCFELTTRVNTTTFENYEPGTIEKFTAEQESAITAQMEAMVQSFKFEE